MLFECAIGGSSSFVHNRTSSPKPTKRLVCRALPPLIMVHLWSNCKVLSYGYDFTRLIKCPRCKLETVGSLFCPIYLSIKTFVRASGRTLLFFFLWEWKWRAIMTARETETEGGREAWKKRERRGFGRSSSEAETETVSPAPATVGVWGKLLDTRWHRQKRRDWHRFSPFSSPLCCFSSNIPLMVKF